MQEVNELKNLVVQGLEANGVLSQLRAQIRSSVFKIIDQQDSNQPSSFHWENPACQKLHDSSQGLQALEIIYEFLSFYKMDYTLSVFKNEGNIKDIKRDDIAKKAGIKNADSSKSLLMNLLNQGGSSNMTKNDDFQDSQKKKDQKQRELEQQREKDNQMKRQQDLQREKEIQMKKQQDQLREKQEQESREKKIYEQKQKEEQDRREKDEKLRNEKQKKEKQERERKEQEERQRQEEQNRMNLEQEDEENLSQQQNEDQQQQSQGFDMSVDSNALEEYDYYEDIIPVK